MLEDISSVLLRTLIIYAGGLLLLRLAGNRVFVRQSPFDLIFAFTMGSTLSRAINGSAESVPTLAAVALLIILHALLGLLGFHFPLLSKVFKGGPTPLIKDGDVSWEDMKRNYLSEGDLLEALRINGHLTEARQVQLGQIERNGIISIVPRSAAPQVVEVGVEEGVKTVRLEFR